MDDRLRSRFECGLIADIAPPELEMRQAILQKKAALENMRIPDEVIAFMAESYPEQYPRPGRRADQADGLRLARPQPRHQAARQRRPERLLCRAHPPSASDIGLGPPGRPRSGRPSPPIRAAPGRRSIRSSTPSPPSSASTGSRSWPAARAAAAAAACTATRPSDVRRPCIWPKK